MKPSDTQAAKAKRSSEQSMAKRFCPRFAGVLSSCVLWGSFLALLLISSLSLFASASFPFYESRLYSEAMKVETVFGSSGIALACSSILAVLCLVGVLFLFWSTRISKCKPWIMLTVVSIWMLAFQLFWIYSLNSNSFVYPDSFQLGAAANDILSGNIEAFADPRDLSEKVFVDKQGINVYFTLYPFQSGSLFLFLGIFALFGQDNYTAFQCINAVVSVLTVVCLYWCTRELTTSRKAINLTLVLFAFCFPLLFSCVLAYGNSMGLLFSALALALLIHGLKMEHKGKRVAFVIAAFVAITLATILKNTCILFLICMVGVIFIDSLKTRKFFLVIMSLVFTIAIQMLSGVSLTALEKITNVDFGDGMPKTSWIAMGLREDNEPEIPGWWSLYAAKGMVAADGDVSIQQEENMKSIGNSLSSFASDPGYCASFFLRKLAAEWADQSFQSLYYSSCCIQLDDRDTWTDLFDDTVQAHDYRRFANSAVYGSLNRPFLIFMDAFQLIVYVAATAYCGILLYRKKKDPSHEFSSVKLVLPLVLLCGFGVYMLWETKSVYVLPFFIMMIPLSGMGLDAAFTRLKRIG